MRRRERIEMTDLIGPEGTAQLIGERVAAWRQRRPRRRGASPASALPCPGSSGPQTGWCAMRPHLRWTDTALRELIEAATGLPTVVGNDATLGVLAEHLFGAARGIDDVVYLNGGASGIGGGLIVQRHAGGRRRRLLGRIRAEPPRHRGDRRSACRQRRARGRSQPRPAARRARAANADEPTLAEMLRTVARAGPSRDEIARQRRILSTALANAVNVLNPAVVVLGGFLAMLAADDLDGLHEAVVAQTMPANGEEPRDPRRRLSPRIACSSAPRKLAFAELLRDPAGVPLALSCALRRVVIRAAEPSSRAG